MSKDRLIRIGVVTAIATGSITGIAAASEFGNSNPKKDTAHHQSVGDYEKFMAQGMNALKIEPLAQGPTFPLELIESENLSNEELGTITFTAPEIISAAVDVHSVPYPSLDQIYLPTKAMPHFWKFVLYKREVIPVFWKNNMSEGNKTLEVGWVRKTDTLTVKSMGLEIRIFAPIDPSSQPAENWQNEFTFSDTLMTSGVKPPVDISYVSFGKWIEANWKGNANLKGKTINFYMLPKLNIQAQKVWVIVNGIPSYASGLSLAKETGKEVVDAYGYFRWDLKGPTSKKSFGVSMLVAGTLSSIAEKGVMGGAQLAFLEFTKKTGSFGKAIPYENGTEKPQKTFIVLGD